MEEPSQVSSELYSKNEQTQNEPKETEKALEPKAEGDSGGMGVIIISGVIGVVVVLLCICGYCCFRKSQGEEDQN